MIAELKVSLATMPILRYGSLDEFTGYVDDYAQESAAAGSRVLLLPELACVGLLWSDPDAAQIDAPHVGAFYRKVLTKQLRAYREALSGIAQRRGIWIAGATFWHERDMAGVNTGFVVSPEGSVAEQDKLHPTRPEKAIGTEGGNALQSFTIDGVKVGLLVCYDVQFPELTRHLVEEDIKVLFVPSLTSDRGYWRVRHAAHARAIENQIYVCVSPLIGDLGIPFDRPLQCTGGAYITCPIDNRFGFVDGSYARAASNVEGILHAALDLGKLQLSREKSEIRQLADRRPDFYAGLKR